MVGDMISIIRRSLLNTLGQWGNDHAKTLRIFRMSRAGGEQFLDESLGR